MTFTNSLCLCPGICSRSHPLHLTRSTGKRAALSHNTSRESSPAPTEFDDDNAPATKKAKTLRPLDTLDDLGMHTDVQVMDIEDSFNPREETLNKLTTLLTSSSSLLLSLLLWDEPRCE